VSEGVLSMKCAGHRRACDWRRGGCFREAAMAAPETLRADVRFLLHRGAQRPARRGRSDIARILSKERLMIHCGHRRDRDSAVQRSPATHRVLCFRWNAQEQTGSLP
jgi:hypothetical protein